MSEPVRQCLVCHFVFGPDDWVATSGGHSAICLRCFETEVKDHKPFPTLMEREIRGILDGITTHTDWWKQ